MTNRRPIVLIATAMATGAIHLAAPVAAEAQRLSARNADTAYGARLNVRGGIDDLNQNRINNRIDSRLDTRLSLRIERYQPDSLADPTAMLAAAPTDTSRAGATIETLPQRDGTAGRP